MGIFILIKAAATIINFTVHGRYMFPASKPETKCKKTIIILHFDFTYLNLIANITGSKYFKLKSHWICNEITGPVEAILLGSSTIFDEKWLKIKIRFS